ncbi:hypothetical protein PG2010B_1361 [Bifidobacterium animalis subsp. lactis]|nr:hypothetical protein PG2007B_1418 [Bifidobacterium animalis subsp. lactis]RYM91635.1 hypothetical protein PG2010B_1361 [Bifidobacterium animalis subsp. lactis]
MQTNKPWRAAASALLAVDLASSGAGVANAADIPPRKPPVNTHRLDQTPQLNSENSSRNMG